MIEETVWGRDWVQRSELLARRRRCIISVGMGWYKWGGVGRWGVGRRGSGGGVDRLRR